MKIRGKILILYLTMALAMVFGVFLGLQFSLGESLKALNRDNIASQLSHLDFFLKDFFQTMGQDLETLMGHPEVQTRQDQDFTSFLNSNPKTFKYNYGPRELEIIRIFNNYRMTHPVVNSVYMGRENGTSVRSHPRNEPTAYDPRQRPWYILAKSNPGKIMVTPAYPALTTKDINLGIVKALTDEGGQVYGVLGMDVTLSSLTDFLSNFHFSPSGNLMIVDPEGQILAFTEKKDLLFTSLKDYSPELHQRLKTSEIPRGPLELQGKQTHLIQKDLGILGWKALVLVPEDAIQQVISNPLGLVVATVGLGLGLWILATFMVMNQIILAPIRRFSAFASRIALTGDLSPRLTYGKTDEIGSLARNWNEMLDSLVQARKRMQTLTSAMERSPLALALIHSDGQVEYSNPAFDRIHREAPFPPEVLGQEPYFQNLRRRINKAGQEVFENLRSYKLGDPQGTERVILFIEDVTQQKLIEGRWFQAQKMEELGLVASGVAHDLNNLLSAIQGFCDLGLLNLQDPGKLQTWLQEIKQATDRGAAITKNLLGSARKKDFQWEDVDLNEILRNFSAFLHILLPQEIRFTPQFSPAPVVIQADRGQIEQIFLNLVVNARDAMPQGGELTLRIYSEGPPQSPEAVLEVQDTGMGMSPEIQDRILEPFFTTKPQGKGSGLGLSLVQGILRTHQGRLEVRSELGKGSVFRVRFPLKSAAPGPRPGIIGP